MSSANNTDRREESWWQILRSATGPIRPEAAEAVLAEYRPLGFVPRDTPDDAPVSSVEDLVARMQVALLEAELKRVAQVAAREAAARATEKPATAPGSAFGLGGQTSDDGGQLPVPPDLGGFLRR